jgi:hypothetical protein
MQSKEQKWHLKKQNPAPIGRLREIGATINDFFAVTAIGTGQVLRGKGKVLICYLVFSVYYLREEGLRGEARPMNWIGGVMTPPDVTEEFNIE